MIAKRYYLFANPHKQETITGAKVLAEQLVNHQTHVYMEEWLHHLLGIGQALPPHQIDNRFSCMISLGGDGTLLRVSSLAASFNVPVLGIHFGRLGFLLETKLTDPESLTFKLINEDFFLEDRILFQATIDDGTSYLVTNEIALMRGDSPSSIKVVVSVDGAKLYSLRGDGVLISTPTGSTCYSLSAGGPVIHPQLECISIVPVCSHAVNHRPVLLPPDKKVEIFMPFENKHASRVYVDGQISLAVARPVRITVTKSDKRVQFIRFKQSNFIKRYREKQLEWYDDEGES